MTKEDDKKRLYFDDARVIDQLKCKLYREILNTHDVDLTESEIRIGYELVRDPFIQDVVSGRYE